MNDLSEPYHHVCNTYEIPRLRDDMREDLKNEMIALHQVALVFATHKISKAQARRIVAFFSDWQ